MGWFSIFVLVALYFLIEFFGENTVLLFFVIGVILVIVLRVLIKNRKKRCPTCKKWFRLKRIKTEKVGVEDISIYQQVETKDYETGRITSTTGQYIPGERIFYEEYFDCRYCQERSSRTYSIDRAKV